MKRYLAAVVAASAIALAASAGGAQAVTLRPVCQHGVGGLTKDLRWDTSAPFYIQISARALSYFAARTTGRTFEGRPAGFNIRQGPCVVADAVAGDAMQAWESWSSDTGNVGVTIGGALPRLFLHLGRFYCTGQSYESSGRTYETCMHTGTHVGTIVVEFVITPASASQ